MKRTDIAMIILIASISIGIAYGTIGSIPALSQKSKSVEVDTIEKYSSNVEQPNAEVFNSKAINPTIDIAIGAAGSSAPADSDTQAEDAGSQTNESQSDNADDSDAPNDDASREQ